MKQVAGTASGGSKKVYPAQQESSLNHQMYYIPPERSNYQYPTHGYSASFGSYDFQPSPSTPRMGLVRPPVSPTTSPVITSSHHARSRSWSMGPSVPVAPAPTLPYPTAPPAPAPPLSAAASGMSSAPLVSHEGQPLLPKSEHQKHSRRPRRRQHRQKSLSSSAATPGYGAFWSDPSAVTAPGAHPSSFDGAIHQSLRHLNNQGQPQSSVKFSPRSEFLHLTQSLHSNESRSNPTSPSVSPAVAFRKQVEWGSSPPSSSSQKRGVVFDENLPPAPLLTNAEGGEAVFLAQKGLLPGGTPLAPSRRHMHRESSRRMHMRQQSAQLWVEEVKGEEQSPACRDIFFFILFVFHLLFIGYLGTIYGQEALLPHRVFNHDNASPTTEISSFSSNVTTAAAEAADMSSEGVGVTIYYHNLIYLGCWSGLFGVVLSSLLLGAMTVFARNFVQITLFIVIALSFIWGTVGIGLSQKTAVPVTGIIALALTVAYAFIVWDRIPFAAANLVTALSGINAFPSTVAVAFCAQFLAVAWFLYYTVVVCGIFDSIDNGKLPVSHEFRVVVYTLLGISFYWTFQVLQNTVQVVTAGVIGGWWYDPDNKAIVRQSCFKTLFYSMGSICFGSLLVGPVRFLRQLSVLFRPTTDENSSLLCLHECLNCIQSCISSCVDSISYNANSWGFTYIGLYGYSFLDASRHASELFEKRGWTMIVSDDLVPNVLLITSLVLGGVTGCFAYVLSMMDRLHVTNLDAPDLMSFAEGIIIGLALTSVLFGVISSSVNTVLVCFCASPVDFERNHPDLSHEMRSAWREVWPGALDVIDIRLAFAAGRPAQDSV